MQLATAALTSLLPSIFLIFCICQFFLVNFSTLNRSKRRKVTYWNGINLSASAEAKNITIHPRNTTGHGQSHGTPCEKQGIICNPPDNCSEHFSLLLLGSSTYRYFPIITIEDYCSKGDKRKFEPGQFRKLSKDILTMEYKITLFRYTYERLFCSERVHQRNFQCPCFPESLAHQLYVNLTAPSWNELRVVSHVELPGGHWKPATCHARESIAVIVPYRDRDDHLRIFLRHMHPFLQRQLIEYQIFIVEQAKPTIFNKAALMNVGYRIASKDSSFRCFVFHDVDLLPEDDRNLYTCLSKPRHMAASVNKFQYKLPYKGLFGGVVAMRREDFENVNGFSNRFYGWGGEDDNMYKRLTAKNISIFRFPLELSRYTMIKHDRDQKNPQYVNRSYDLIPNFFNEDGLSNLNFKIEEVQNRPFYTWIYASLFN